MRCWNPYTPRTSSLDGNRILTTKITAALHNTDGGIIHHQHQQQQSTGRHSARPSQAPAAVKIESPAAELEDWEKIAKTKLSTFTSMVKQEISITYALMESNLLAHLILGSSCSIAFGLASGMDDLSYWVPTMAKSIVWFTLYGFIFDASNQISGLEEDKQNSLTVASKRNRPLVSGELTVDEAMKRFVLSIVLFLMASWTWGGLPLTLLALSFIVTSVLHNFCAFDKIFVTKNYFSMSAGSAAMLLGARILAGEEATSRLCRRCSRFP